MHDFIKAAGFKNKKDFYSRYKTPEEFFIDYPHMANGGSYSGTYTVDGMYYANGGQLNVEQNQYLPPDHSVENSLRNVEETRSAGKSRKKGMGGSSAPCYNCGGMKYQTGGPTYEYIHQDKRGNKFTLHQGEPITAQAFDNLVDVSRAHPYNPQSMGASMGYIPTAPVANTSMQPPAAYGSYSAVSQVPTSEPTKAVGNMGYGADPIGDVRSQYANKGGMAYDVNPYQYGGAPNPAIHNMTGGMAQGCIGDLNYHVGGEFYPDLDEYKKGGHWIQKAVNPAHKGYCTPMTKSTCTPRRKAFAMTMKKHHGFHKDGGFTTDGTLYANQTEPNYGTFLPFGVRVAKDGGFTSDGTLFANQTNPNYGTYTSFGVRVAQEGGVINPYQYEYSPGGYYQLGGTNPWGSTNTNTPEQMQQAYAPVAQANAEATQESPMGQPNKPMVSSSYAAKPGEEGQMQDASNFQNPYEHQDYPTGPEAAGFDEQKKKRRGYGFNANMQMASNAIGALNAVGSMFGNIKQSRANQAAARDRGMTSSIYPHVNPMGSKGDYGTTGQGYGQPITNSGYNRAGMFYPPTAKYGGQQYQAGGTYDLDQATIDSLIRQGYNVEFLD